MSISKRLVKETSKLALILGLSSLINPPEVNAQATMGFGTQTSYEINITPPKNVSDIKGYKIHWGIGADADNGVYPFLIDVGNTNKAIIQGLPLATNIAFSCSWYSQNSQGGPSPPVKAYSFERITMGLGHISDSQLTNAQCYYFILKGPKNPPFFEGFKYSFNTNNPSGWTKAPRVLIANEFRETNGSSVNLAYLVPVVDCNDSPNTKSIYFRQTFPNETPSTLRKLRIVFD